MEWAAEYGVRRAGEPDGAAERGALLRRTWSTMQEAPQLRIHLEWWRAYYHFVRPHASLRVALAQPIDRGGKRQPQRYWQSTPAMAARLTHRPWTVRELLALPLLPARGSLRVGSRGALATGGT